MKNLLKFFAFVALLSLAISALYDYRLKHGGLSTLRRNAPEKYTLASSPNVDPKQVASLEALNRERRALVSAVVPSVVAVKTTKKIAIERQNQLDPFGFFFRRPRGFQSPNDDALVQNSLGSGVIVTNEGHIITNNHVVDQVDEIEVQLSDGRTEKARLVGSDEQVDLAVLKIDNAGVKPLKLADSDTVQAGDFVLAIGNPFGFDETVTDGIVSSKGRPNRADVFGDLIQTNAAINPGNSGGPLLNLRGEVVGLNTAIASASGANEGIGFAIPINMVMVIADQLIERGIVTRAYLGVRLEKSFGPADAAKLGLARPEGTRVSGIERSSPAEKARILVGDVILEFDGTRIEDDMHLINLVSLTPVQKEVDIRLLREGRSISLRLRVANRAQMPRD